MAAGLAEVMSQSADAMAEALGSDQKDNPKGTIPDVKGEVKRNVGEAFVKLRSEVASGVSGKEGEFKSLVKDPSLDRGIEIVESYNLGRPRLTEKLSDTLPATSI